MQGTTFTFLSRDAEDDADSTPDLHSHVGAVEDIRTNPWQPTTKLPYDSSDDNDDDDGDDMDYQATGIQSGKATSQLNELFFFHPDDPELANRINGRMILTFVELLRVLASGIVKGDVVLHAERVYRYQHI